MDVRMLRGSMDVKGLNIQRLMDVKLNELPKQILMLLPLLLLLLLLLYSMYFTMYLYGGAKRPLIIT